MKGLHDIGIVLLAVVAPVLAWLVLVVVGPLPPMGLAGAMFEMLILPALLVGGFVLLTKVFKKRMGLLASLYFPIMLALMLYLGLLVAWQLQRDSF